GAVIEPGTLLDVGISLGIINITVPNLIGLPLSEAQLIIEEYSSLNFESLNEPHVTVPVGTIFIQTPMPGDQIAFNETVTFSISTGPPTGDEVIVPNFFGIEASVLPQMVEEAGLALGNISFTSNNMPEGLVINQTIPVGSAVLQGHVINFVVSTGPIVETPTIIEPTPDPPAAEPEDEPHEEEPIEDEPIEDIISEEEPSEDDNGEEDIPEVPVTQTTVTIPMPVLDEDQTLVFANIIFQSDLAGNQLLLYRAVDISEFPFQFTVEGSGTVIFWADGDLVSSQSVQ
ncbi:MAG: PASTA domain-containing protein, partial [Defluviitaleaceae bacterium]|nr:PASTA domain-containing protein [Defluviitaleaceae bacterium]